MLESCFDLEDILVGIFYWFDKTSKTKIDLHEFCFSCDQE